MEFSFSGLHPDLPIGTQICSENEYQNLYGMKWVLKLFVKQSKSRNESCIYVALSLSPECDHCSVFVDVKYTVGCGQISSISQTFQSELFGKTFERIKFISSHLPESTLQLGVAL